MHHPRCEARQKSDIERKQSGATCPPLHRGHGCAPALCFGAPSPCTVRGGGAPDNDFVGGGPATVRRLFGIEGLLPLPRLATVLPTGPGRLVMNGEAPVPVNRSDRPHRGRMVGLGGCDRRVAQRFVAISQSVYFGDRGRQTARRLTDRS